MLTNIADPGQSFEPLLETLTAAAKRQGYLFHRAAGETAAQISELSPERQRAFILASLHWFNRFNEPGYNPDVWAVREVMLSVLKHALPFEHDDILCLLDWSIAQATNYWRGVPQLVKTLKHYLDGRPLPQTFAPKVERLIERIETSRSDTDLRRWAAELRALRGPAPEPVPPE